MFPFFILLLHALSQCNAHPRDKRLVGGKDDFKNHYPFLASLRSYDYLIPHLCGAAVITEYSLITAAHCIVNSGRKNIEVFFYGTITHHTIHKLMVHPDYNSSQPRHDIAIIELEKPLPIGTKIKTISLPIDITITPGDKVTATGWKNEYMFTNPQYLEQNIMPDKECWSSLSTNNIRVGHDVICTTDCRIGASFGDSGSPLVYTNGGQSYIVGVTTCIAATYSSERECVLRHSGYSNVSSSLPWIQTVLKTATRTMASGDKKL